MDLAWAADGVMSATVAVVADPEASAEELLGRLGPVEPLGELTFDRAEDLKGAFYEDGTDRKRAVFQLHNVIGRGVGWWGVLEPNGFHLSSEDQLLALAAGHVAVSVFWNVNSDMRVLRVEEGRVISVFDPLLDVNKVPAEGRDLPFGTESPRAAALTLLERWTGVPITQQWFQTPKPTFIVASDTSEASRADAPTSKRFSVFARVRGPSPAVAKPPRPSPPLPRMVIGQARFTPSGEIRLQEPEEPMHWHVTLNDGTIVDVWATAYSIAGDDYVFEIQADVPGELPSDLLVTARIPGDSRRVTIGVARFPISAVRHIGSGSTDDRRSGDR